MSAPGITPEQAAAQLGISLHDLKALLARTAAPTVAEYMDTAIEAISAKSRSTYVTYLKRFAAGPNGAKPVSSVTTTDVKRFVEQCKDSAQEVRGTRRRSRGGLSAQENAIAALRAFFAAAEADDHVLKNPALAVKKPRRRKQSRSGLDITQLHELTTVTVTTGNDADLDALLVRFLLESGARRGGAIALRVGDIDPARATVLLREKNDPEGTEQPVSPSLVSAMLRFARSRGASVPVDSVFRTRAGSPITARRFDNLVNRWHANLPWAARLGLSTHSLRHTSIGMVEASTTYATARAFARHVDERDTTTSYLRRNIYDVAWAVQQLTCEAHPLARDRFAQDAEAGAEE